MIPSRSNLATFSQVNAFLLAGLAFKSKSVLSIFNFFISFKDKNIFSYLTH